MLAFLCRLSGPPSGCGSKISIPNGLPMDSILTQAHTISLLTSQLAAAHRGVFLSPLEAPKFPHRPKGNGPGRKVITTHGWTCTRVGPTGKNPFAKFSSRAIGGLGLPIYLYPKQEPEVPIPKPPIQITNPDQRVHLKGKLS